MFGYLGASGGRFGVDLGVNLGSILEVKVHEKSIKNGIKFQIKFWMAFLTDLKWILDLFWVFFLMQMVIQIEKGDFSKIIEHFLENLAF